MGNIWELTEKNHDRRKSSNNSGVSALLHDIVHSGDRKAAKYGWQGSHSPVWNVTGRVAVADVRKVKVALKTDKPSRKSDQQLGEWGMNVEIVLATQIIRSELSEMDLVKTIGVKIQLLGFSESKMRRRTRPGPGDSTSQIEQ